MSAILRRRRSGQAVLSVLSGAVGFALIAFHVSLLWRRFLDASIAEPAIIARWIASAFLVAALFAARGKSRNRVPVLWLLVALLHAGMPAVQHAAEQPVPIAVVVQIGVVAMCGALLAVASGFTSVPAFVSTAIGAENATAPSYFGCLTLPGRSPPVR
jgi:ribose/xylose/arabinose/galactoside ABC-type transport system permease subunit